MGKRDRYRVPDVERHRQACRFPMYEKLARLCTGAGYSLELAGPVAGVLELAVYGKSGTGPLATPFDVANPDASATLLLSILGE